MNKVKKGKLNIEAAAELWVNLVFAHIVSKREIKKRQNKKEENERFYKGS